MAVDENNTLLCTRPGLAAQIAVADPPQWRAFKVPAIDIGVIRLGGGAMIHKRVA